jgi:CDP-4-dehydro-6-deoxyglucose reductase
MGVETFEIEIVSMKALAPSVKEFVFSRTDNQPLVYAPGQWLNLVLPMPDGDIRRAYSIASPPAQSAQFELAVTEVSGGPGSGYLCGLGQAARLSAIGPHGFFTRDATDPAPALMVATGTGVTPMRAMVMAALAAQSGADLWLLVGVRHEEDMLYRAQLEALERAHSNVRVFFTLSRPSAEWRGRRGYVQEHVPELWAQLIDLRKGDPHVYVCGLEKMVSAVRQLVRRDLFVPRERVHSERYD